MRNITPETFADEFFGTLPMTYRLLWIGLITNIADDQGRMLDNPALIRSLIFPYDAKITVAMIEKGLALFAKKHKIERYHAGTNGSGRQLIQIVHWWKYQHSAQWAAKSAYPPPAKWADRVRIHIAGGGGQPFTMNWDKLGGYVASMKGIGTSYEGYTPIPIPTHTPTPTQKINQPTTHNPPSTKKQARTLAGRVGGDEDNSTEFTPSEKRIAKSIRPVLQSAGLGKPRFETLIHNLATRRNLKNALTLTLAALASSYADDKVNNKVIVAVHRLEEDSIPAEYFDPSKWTVIPASVLKGAGIDDLNQYITKFKINNFFGDSHDRKVAALRSRSQEDTE